MIYGLSAIASIPTLQWKPRQARLRPLPSFIQRRMISSAGGDLELLVCEPSESTSRQDSVPSLFFIHGGFGHASVWLEWMIYLYEHKYPATLYAFSARNHGASYTLPYYRHVFETTFEELLDDAALCIAQTGEQTPSILVGHSSGGGIAQALLARGTVKASGLALIDAIPSYGSYDMYWNWFKHDPWFILRSWLHLQHPISPLSNDSLVQGAFFGHLCSLSQAAEFRTHMPGYEAYGWPMAMFGTSFWKWLRGQGTWLNCRDVVKSIELERNEPVCVLIGREDMMYRPWMWEKQAQEYAKVLPNKQTSSALEYRSGPILVKKEAGIRLIIADDSGHHVQNDVHSDLTAEALMQWALEV